MVLVYQVPSENSLILASSEFVYIVTLCMYVCVYHSVSGGYHISMGNTWHGMAWHGMTRHGMAWHVI